MPLMTQTVYFSILGGGGGGGGNLGAVTIASVFRRVELDAS